MKKNKGITLIALVITIIVLLILAGVAISMLSGENGILRKAAEAKTKTEEAQKEESITLLDIEIDGIFIEKGSKYKCRYGCITGIDEGEKAENLNNVLGMQGYILRNIENTDDVLDSTTLTTGMKVVKNGEVVAKTVIFGDVDCNGSIETEDITALQRFSANNKLNNETDCKEAMDVNHDGFIDEDDYIMLNRYKAGWTSISINQYKYVQKLIEDIVIMSDSEIINSLNICDKDDFKENYNAADDYTYYEINMNKSYSYNELAEKIKNVDTRYKTVKFYDTNFENEIGSSSEDTVKSGEWIEIDIDKVKKEATVPENEYIYLKIK